MRLASTFLPSHQLRSRSNSPVAKARDLPALRQRFVNRKPWKPARYWLTALSRLPLRSALPTRPSSFLASARTSACCSAESWAACATCSAACSWTPELTTPGFVVTSDMFYPPSGTMAHGVLQHAVGRFMRCQHIASGDHSQLSARYSSREMP